MRRAARRLVPRATNAQRLFGSYCIHPSDGLSAEQREIQKVARQFALKEMYPNMRHWDETQELPTDCLRKAGELGFGAIYCREEHGGAGLSRLDSSLIFECLAAGCTSTSAYLAVHNMCSWILDTFGTEELKIRHLSSMADLTALNAYCLTEPDAGSDAANLRTSFRREKDFLVINGSKAFISGSGKANNYLVFARHENKPGPKGVCCILVEAGTKGFSIGKKEQKLGWNSSPAAILSFDECKVPATNMIGGEHQGFAIAMAGMNGTRVNIASCSLGAAQMSLDMAIEHLKVRTQFSKPLADFQWNQFKLADAAAKLHASRVLVRQAAQHLDAHSPQKAAHCAMAKMFATDACSEVVDQCLQFFGGYGFLKDYPIQQYLRDIRVHQIIGGTNEVMRMLVARSLLKSQTYLVQ